MTIFDTQIEKTLTKEGPYSNDASDSGGETAWGVTEAIARAFGYQGAMRDMTRDQAITIYRRRYWTAPRFDQVALIDGPLASRMLDCGINCGPAVPGQFLQRALNALNNGGKLYPDMTVDGGVGNVTLAALKAFIAAPGDAGRSVLLNMVKAQQSVRYLEIAEGSPTQEVFEWGWQLNRVA
jgi:lysozyme family protein